MFDQSKNTNQINLLKRSEDFFQRKVVVRKIYEDRSVLQEKAMS
ncbi:hypothetical protein [Bacillus cereus]|nr:hypothetical protein [Bacillus cereus]